MIYKGNIFVIIGMVALMALTGCQGTVEETATADVARASDTTGDSEGTISVASVISEDGADATVPTSAAALAENAANDSTVVTVMDTGAAVTIALNGDSIAVEGEGVRVDGSVATITAAGTYSLSGALADGQISVDTEDDGAVQLILNGVDIRSATSAPLALMNAEQVVVVLTDNTANYLEDAATYSYLDPVEEEPSAALFSNADLVITGNGSLSVSANFNEAISSDDSLTIEGGNINVTAADDGIRGKDYLLVKAGAISVNAGGDGLKSDNDEDTALGYVAVEGGTITINAGGDAVQGETDVIVTGGEFDLMAGGGNAALVAADASAKGIKGVTSVIIDGGTFAIDAADDAVHSNGSITINGGTFALASGDDGIHADSTVMINGGTVAIANAYEGIESAVITINDGDIHVVAADDGINVAGGVDGSGMMAGPGRGGRGGPGAPGAMVGGETFTYTGDYYLYINGGTVVVDAAGDGIDVNGAIEMSGGVVLVNGPTEQMNGALDYDGTFNISGGYFVAAGSAGMAQAPGAASTQNSVLVNLSGTLPGGTLVNIQDESGQSVLTFAPSKDFQSIAFSSAGLVTGSEYTLFYGGSAGGTVVDGLYVDGMYAPGDEYASFTIAGVTTVMGAGGFR